MWQQRGKKSETTPRTSGCSLRLIASKLGIIFLSPGLTLSLTVKHYPSALSPLLCLCLSCSLFVFCLFCCLCTNMSAVLLPASQSVWSIYLIITRLNSLWQWRLIWRGSPGLFSPPLCAKYNKSSFSIPSCAFIISRFFNVRAFFLKGFYWISCWTLLLGHFFPPFSSRLHLLPDSLFPPTPVCHFFSPVRQ